MHTFFNFPNAFSPRMTKTENLLRGRKKGETENKKPNYECIQLPTTKEFFNLAPFFHSVIPPSIT